MFANKRFNLFLVNYLRVLEKKILKIIILSYKENRGRIFALVQVSVVKCPKERFCHVNS